MHVQNTEQRKEICLKCPIYSSFTQKCNPKLWINPDTDDVSTKPKAGYIRGCGCYILVKMKNLNAHCIAGKW